MSKQSFEMQIANPIMARGLRYKDEGGCYPSATTTLHSVTAVQQFAGNLATYSTVPSGAYVQYLFRDVLRSTVTFVANQLVGGNPKNYSYQAQFSLTGAITGFQAYPADASEEVQLDILNLTDNYASSTSSAYLHPHGTTLYTGLALGRKCVYMDIGAISTVAQTTTSNTMELLVYKWNGISFDLQGTNIAFSSKVAVFTATTQGYYAFSVIDTAVTANTIAMALTGSGDVFGHLPIPQVDTQLLNLQQSRVLANSLLISNTASALNVEGSVWAAQFPGSDLWYNHQTSASIGVAREMYEGRAATGVYGWLKPYKTADFDYRPVITCSGSLVTNSSFSLADACPFVVFVVNTVSTGTTWPGLDFLVTQSTALEFVTQSQWYEAEYPMMDTLGRIKAIDSLEAVPQFSENPTHLDNIWEAVKQGGRYIGAHKQLIGAAISTMYPGLAGVTGALGGLSRASFRTADHKTTAPAPPPAPPRAVYREFRRQRAPPQPRPRPQPRRQQPRRQPPRAAIKAEVKKEVKKDIKKIGGVAQFLQSHPNHNRGRGRR